MRKIANDRDQKVIAEARAAAEEAARLAAPSEDEMANEVFGGEEEDVLVETPEGGAE